MRQSISKSKNYITNTIKTFTKYKPEDATMRGTTKIELFKADTGEKTYELDTENFVSQVVEDRRKAFANLAIMLSNDMYNHGATSLYHSNTSNNFGSYNSTSYFNLFNKNYSAPKDLFAYLVLTDYDGPEDPLYERGTKGNVISFAQREVKYTGTNNQGSFNSIESNLVPTTKNKAFKFVYDFPTHAANGIINSIYFQDVSGISTSTSYVDFATPRQYIDEAMSLIEEHKLNLHDVRESSILINKKWNALFSNEDKNVFLTINPGTSEYNLMEIKDEVPELESTNRIVHVERLANGDILLCTVKHAFLYDSEGYRKDFAEGVSQIVINVGTKSMGTNAIGNVCVIDNYLYTCSNYNMNSWNSSYTCYGTHIYKFDLSTGKAVSNRSMSSNYGSSSYTRRLWLLNNEDTDAVYIGVEDTRVSWVYYMDMNLSSSSETVPTGFTGRVIPQYYIKTGGYVERGNIGTRNLLPEPIVKTSDYTMKITYEIRFE